jgi:H+/Cl- antiporter ClcA
MNNLKVFLRSIAIIGSIVVAGLSVYLFYLESVNQRLFEYFNFSDFLNFLFIGLFVGLVGGLIFFYFLLLFNKKYGMTFSIILLSVLSALSIVIYSSMILSVIFVANLVGLSLAIYFTRQKPENKKYVKPSSSKTAKEQTDKNSEN